MKVFFFAVLGVFFGLSFFIPEFQELIKLDHKIELYRNITITTLFALLFMEGFLFRIKLKNVKETSKPDENNENIIETKNKDQLSELNAKILKKDQRIKELELAFNDNEKKVEKLLKESLEDSKSSTGTEAVSLLSMLQQKGRFLDFIMDDITSYPDPQVGAAARVVHQGCAKVMKDFFEIAPIQSIPEGEKITVSDEKEIAQYKLLGNISDELPYTGTLVHKGWMTKKVDLPKSSEIIINKADSKLITPAEIELH